jgi:transitional endoplasmic reticulum ATPase
MNGYTGADIASVASAAVMLALRQHISKYPDPKESEEHAKELKVTMQHFKEAMKKIRPLSKQELDMYKRIADQFGKPISSTIDDTSLGLTKSQFKSSLAAS